MKFLASTLMSLLLASPAFAIGVNDLIQTLQHKDVKALLQQGTIKSITDGPSYRCAGCFGMTLTVYRFYDRVDEQYQIKGSRFKDDLEITIVPKN